MGEAGECNMINSKLLTPQYIYASVDFMASTIAFMERQKKPIDVLMIETKIPCDYLDFFKEQLAHYRYIYIPR